MAADVLAPYVALDSPLIRGRISTTCVVSMWRNDTKCKYMFMFPLKNLAHKGFRNSRGFASLKFRCMWFDIHGTDWMLVWLISVVKDVLAVIADGLARNATRPQMTIRMTWAGQLQVGSCQCWSLVTGVVKKTVACICEIVNRPAFRHMIWHTRIKDNECNSCLLYLHSENKR